MQRGHEYVEALEEERRKIQLFQRELPLCLELVTQAIDACRQRLLCGVTKEYFVRQSESSDQTLSEGPAFEEFLPVKRPSLSSSDDEEEEQKKSHKSNNKSDHRNIDKLSKKSDWLRSAQLWNPTPDSPTKEDAPISTSILEVKVNSGGAFHPFKKEKTPPSAVEAPVVAANSSAEMSGDGSNGDGGCKRDKRDGQSQRKTRRCWSQELHKRFLHALQELGGCHVATPKQIRELMKVDGLTNDEVKSHLQKYRLHTSRPSPSVRSKNNPQPPQFVVVGGIWVPPPGYAAPAATTVVSGEASGVTSPTGLYARAAEALPPAFAPNTSSTSLNQMHHKQQSSHSDDMSCRSDGRVHSNHSPAASSSTRTTTASPVY